MHRLLAFVSAVLVAVLLVAGCGGDDTAQEDPQTTVSEVATSDTDQPGTTTVPDSPEQPDQADSDVDGEQAAEPEAQPQPAPALVRLGDRFAWCADIQALWWRQAELQSEADAASEARLQAYEAHEAATDELTEAETRQAVEAADERYYEAVAALEDVISAVTRPLISDRTANDETEEIALGLARAAFREAADPALIELLPGGAVDEALRSTTVEEPAAEEPAAAETTAPLSQPEPMPLDELLQALQEMEADAADLAQVVQDAVWERDRATSLVRDAQTPAEVSDLVVAFQEWNRTAEEAWMTSRVIDEDSVKMIRAWEAHARQMQRDGVISVQQLSDDSDAVTEAVRNVAELTRFVRGSDSLVVRSDFSDAFTSTRTRLMLADPAWAAFKRSLAESCEPT